MARIFFAGIKHSGKTRMAKLVSAMLGMESVDADDLALPLLDGLAVREYYRKYGKEAFMKKEYEAVKHYSEGRESFIMSLGGGASDNSDLMGFIKNSGCIIYLRRNEKDMLPVILRDGIPPFLDANDPEGSFHDLYQKRDMKYRAGADLVIDLGPYQDKEETAKRILSALKEHGYV